MGIYINNRPVIAIYRNGQSISQVYTNTQLVWPIPSINPDSPMLSCFSNGYWIDEYPWDDGEGWVD